VLTEQERAGVNITQAWRDKSFATMVSQPGTNGSVAFRFRESLPSIVCAILQLTDIELQPGEVVTQLMLGTQHGGRSSRQYPGRDPSRSSTS
jgi:type IV secretion system protein TrbG